MSSSFLKATGLCRARFNCSRCKIIEADSGAAPGAPLVPSVSHRLPRRAGASDPRARPRTPGDVAAAGGEPRATPARVRAEGVVGRAPPRPSPTAASPPPRPPPPPPPPPRSRKTGARARRRTSTWRRCAASSRTFARETRPRRTRTRSASTPSPRSSRRAGAQDYVSTVGPAAAAAAADDSVGARPRHRVHVRRRRLTSPGPPAFARRPAAATHGGRRPGVLLSSVLLILRTDDETIAKSRISASRRPVGRRRSREGEGAAGPSGGPHGRARRAGGRRARERDRDGAVVGAEPARARSRGDWSGAQRRVSALGGWEAGGGV